MSETCGNPVCSNLIGPKEKGNWRRTPRKYCSDRCKMDGWAIKHARDLLASLPEDRRREILATGRNMADERCSHARAYRCRRYPQLAIGKRVRFSNGIFETNDSDLQRFVESNEWFGIYIERIDLVGQMTEPNLRTPERLGIDSSPFYRKANREQPEGRPLGTIGL
jgi:hypothetical protein